MTSKGRKIESDLRRRPPSRQPLHRLLLVCEGEKTEIQYFKAFQHDARNPRVHVEVAHDKSEPLKVVEAAVRFRDDARAEAARQHDRNLEWDEVWAVFDIDEHLHVAEARALAERESIHLAISNPCFELWALLHFHDQRAPLTRRQAHSKLVSHMKGYSKELDYPRMRGGYHDALSRARSLDEDAARTGQRGKNPTTGVHRVTERIRSGT